MFCWYRTEVRFQPNLWRVSFFLSFSRGSLFVEYALRRLDQQNYENDWLYNVEKLNPLSLYKRSNNHCRLLNQEQSISVFCLRACPIRTGFLNMTRQWVRGCCVVGASSSGSTSKEVIMMRFLMRLSKGYAKTWSCRPICSFSSLNGGTNKRQGDKEITLPCGSGTEEKSGTHLTIGVANGQSG